MVSPCSFPFHLLANIQVEKVSYEADGVKMEGSITYDDKIKIPAIWDSRIQINLLACVHL